MMLKTIKPLLLLIFIAITTSCSYRVADLTMVATRNIEDDTDYVELKQYQKGEDKAIETVLFIGPLDRPNVEEAIDDAIKKVEGGEFMKNVVIREVYRFWLFWSTVTYEVEGDVWGKKTE